MVFWGQEREGREQPKPDRLSQAPPACVTRLRRLDATAQSRPMTPGRGRRQGAHTRPRRRAEDTQLENLRAGGLFCSDPQVPDEPLSHPFADEERAYSTLLALGGAFFISFCVTSLSSMARPLPPIPRAPPRPQPEGRVPFASQ